MLKTKQTKEKMLSWLLHSFQIEWQTMVDLFNNCLPSAAKLCRTYIDSYIDLMEKFEAISEKCAYILRKCLDDQYWQRLGITKERLMHREGYGDIK